MFSRVKIKYKVLFVSLFPFLVMMIFVGSYLLDQYRGYTKAVYDRKIVELFGIGGELTQALYDDMSLGIDQYNRTSLKDSAESGRLNDKIIQRSQDFQALAKKLNLLKLQDTAINDLEKTRTQMKNKALPPLEAIETYKKKTNQIKNSLAEIAHKVYEPTLFQLMVLYIIGLEDRVNFEDEEHLVIEMAKNPEKAADLVGPLNHVIGKQDANRTMFLILGTSAHAELYNKLNPQSFINEAKQRRDQLTVEGAEEFDLKEWNSIQERRVSQNTRLESQLFQMMMDEANALESKYYNLFLKILVAIIVTIPVTLLLIYYTLKSISAQLEGQVSLLKESADKILGSLTETSSGTSETAASVAETTSTVEELKQTAEMASDNAKNVSEVTQTSLVSLKEVEKHLTSHMDGMTKIEEGMQTISNTIVELSDQSLTIGNIIDTVDDLAEQSHLLAINAAIEAAKAKEHGKGFSVVAQEIRNLAEQSKQATVQVRKILNDIKNSTSSAVMATEQGSKAVNFGMQFSGSMSDTIKTLSESIVKAASATEQISQNSEQQLIGVSQVNLAMVNIKEASGQHVEQVRHIEGALQGLNNVATNISKLITDLRF